MDVDKPPDFMTLLLIGLGVVVLFGCCCCTTLPLIPLAQQRGVIGHRR